MIAFESVANFVRNFARISSKTPITPATEFERDLGITGDDGVELLEEAEKVFSVSFAGETYTLRDVFGLGSKEHLFESEGLDLFGIFRGQHYVHRFTVGELHQAIQRLAPP